jgi:hypothetical protein
MNGSKKNRLRWFATTLLLVAIGVLILAASAILKFGSIEAALAFVAGDRLLISTQTQSVGDLLPGQRSTVEFRLTNLSNAPVIVVGARVSCVCVSVQELPLAVPRSETRRLAIVVRAPAKQGLISENIQLYTNAPGESMRTLKIVGRVVVPPTTVSSHSGGR